MKIQILGTGCAKCKTLYNAVKEVIKENSIEASLEKIEDLEQIMEMGVMTTPALAIDGKVVLTGSASKSAIEDALIKNKANDSKPSGGCCCCGG